MNKYVMYGGFGAALILIGLVSVNGFDAKRDTSLPVPESVAQLNELNTCVEKTGNTLLNCSIAQDAAKNAAAVQKILNSTKPTPESITRDAAADEKMKAYNACVNSTAIEKWQEVCNPLVN